MSMCPWQMLEGKHARRNGLPRNPPDPSYTKDGALWCRGWDIEDIFIKARERREAAKNREGSTK